LFQKSPHWHSCETIDVVSLFQRTNRRQESFSVLSKPQISRQLLESLVTETNTIMPLAQNYKDDVSLLESETVLSKTAMTDLASRQEAIVSKSFFLLRFSMKYTFVRLFIFLTSSTCWMRMNENWLLSVIK